MNLDRWSHLRASGPFALSGPAVAGISGGRTSAMLASLLHEDVVLCFQNTGREHPKTLEFLRRLEEGLRRPIVWLEMRPPKRRGAPPREFGFEVVTYETASRDGRPFFDMLRCLREFRETKGEPPIAPHAMGRICTAFLKHRAMEKWLASIGFGVDGMDWSVGLRADEEPRVRRLKARETRRVSFRVPLFEAGIVKADVYEFWSKQTFDLGIRDDQGNCTGCFLKDQADLARLMHEPETDGAWWIEAQENYPDFGGRRFPRYEDLAKEAPARLAIESALRAGEKPPNEGLPAARFRLVVAQERKRIAGERAPVSCACESTLGLGQDEEDVA